MKSRRGDEAAPPTGYSRVSQHLLKLASCCERLAESKSLSIPGNRFAGRVSSTPLDVLGNIGRSVTSFETNQGGGPPGPGGWHPSLGAAPRMCKLTSIFDTRGLGRFFDSIPSYYKPPLLPRRPGIVPSFNTRFIVLILLRFLALVRFGCSLLVLAPPLVSSLPTRPPHFPA